MDEANGINQGNAGRLQQMSEDMKLHIAQLKAELANADIERRGMRDLQKEFRNKAVATVLRKKMESEQKLQNTTSQQTGTSPDKSPGNLPKYDVIEPLADVMTETEARIAPYVPKPEPQQNPADLSNDVDKAAALTNDDNVKQATLVDNSKLQRINESTDLENRGMSNKENKTNLDATMESPGNQRKNRLLPEQRSSTLSNAIETGNKTSEKSPNHKGRSKSRIPGSSRKRKSRSRHDDSLSSSETSQSSPRSPLTATEDSIPVKYLQMSSNSPRLMKRTKSSRYRGSSAPATARGSRNDLPLDVGSTSNSANEKSKYNQLEARLNELQLQCEALAAENIRIKREQRSKAEEKISSLKRSNGELANIARRLEEKARSLQETSVKKTQELASVTRELQQQKRAQQRHRARWESEQTRILAECNDQLISSRGQVEDLKRALRQARKEKAIQIPDKESGDDNNFMKQNQLEMLQLQKLAAAASTKVVVRSLSTPVTARQKILEESNRNLRRQITTLENTVQEAEARVLQTDEIQENLKVSLEEKANLNKEIDQLKCSVSSLESELQQSKVETSDISFQLTDLKHIHVQLQNDYSTVHEQLSVAIKERDQAVHQCIENAGKLSEMDSAVKKLQNSEESYQVLQNNHQAMEDLHKKEVNKIVNSHDAIVSEYQEAILTLQSKVQLLEQQCQEHEVTNRNMKKQLSVLVEWSKSKDLPDPTLPQTNNRQTSDNKNNNNIRGSSRSSVHSGSPLPRDLAMLSQGHRSLTPKINLSNEAATFPQSMKKQVTENDDTEAEDFDEEIMTHGGAILPADGANGSTAPLLQVFIAKYSYNPFDGPNEHPETELSLMAGDYVYVYGDMDDDGFYEGELMNGKHGLVPSNFLELVREPTPSGVASYDGSAESAPNVDETGKPRRTVSREGSVRNGRSGSSDANRSMSSSFNSAVDELAPSSGEARYSNMRILPYPRKLRVDKKLSHSLIIGWVAPQLNEDDLVEEYHVLVDGILATVVNGNKSKAVVENIYHDKKFYLISVCAVTEHGRSEPGHCVLTHGGQRSSDCVTDLKTEHVTTGSARVSWKPTNSNAAQSISIGEVTAENKHKEMLSQYQRQIIVPPPMFRHTITGLKANTSYELVVRSRGSKLEAESTSPVLRFTTPLSGPPDPPISVQLEETSSDFVAVTWLPVTINDGGTSNGVVVSGYSVYINDVKLRSVEPSTCDQCQLSLKEISDHVRKVVDDDVSYRHRSDSWHSNSSSAHSSASLFTHCMPSVKVTARTVAVGGQLSDDSVPCYLPRALVGKLLRVAATPSDIRKAGGTDATETAAGNWNPETRQSAVPSIEITQDTSSEEEGELRADFYGKSGDQTPSTARQAGSPDRSAKSAEASRPNGTVGGDYAKLFRQNGSLRSRSANHGRAERSTDPRATLPSYGRRINSDEESGSSATSGGHSSSSTSGSLRVKHMKRPDRPDRALSGIDPGQDRTRKVDKLSGSPRSIRSSEKERRPVVVAKHRKRSANTTSSLSGRESASEFESMEDSRVFLFVALYDYNPYLMSPNTESLDDELSFSDGQLIKVYGEKDGDGFYLGETQNGKRGYVPCNMVSSVQVEDFTMLEELFEQGHLPPVSPQANTANENISQQISDSHLIETHSSIANDDECYQAIVFVALFDYDPKESSPNIDAEVELSFSRGDLVNVYGPMDEDGFYRGEIQGQFGLVPSNFLEEVTDDQLEKIKQLNHSSGKANSVTKISSTTMTEPAEVTSSKLHNVTFGDPNSVVSTSSNTSSLRSDVGKKKGIFSKGKKLLKKLGSNEASKNRR